MYMAHCLTQFSVSNITDILTYARHIYLSGKKVTYSVMEIVCNKSIIPSREH